MDFSPNKFVQDNLSNLEAQEKELNRLLEVIRKAKELFVKASGGNLATTTAKKETSVKVVVKGKSRGRKSKAVAAEDVSEIVAKTSKSKKKAKTRRAPRNSAGGTTYKDKIIDVLRSKGAAMTSKEIIDVLFQSETGIDYETFKRNIYPVLSKAYKNKELVNNDGQIALP